MAMDMAMKLASLIVILLIIDMSQSLKIKVLNGTTTIKTYKDKYAVIRSKSYMPLYGDLSGRLVYVNPRNACSSVDPTNATNLIAFVPNYDDCIGQNAMNILDGGFIMMITYSKGDKKILQDYSDLSQAIVKEEFATYLIENVVVNENDTSNDIQLFVSEDFMAFYEMLLIVCGLVLMCAIMLAVVMFFSICCCRWSLRKWRRRGLAVWRIRQLPRRRYHQGKESTETCSICLEDFEEREYIRVLPCDHVFHPPCVDEWLKNWNRVCPLCKASISRSRGHQQSEREPLLSNDLGSVESSTYGSVRLSDSNLAENEPPESESESDTASPTDNHTNRNTEST